MRDRAIAPVVGKMLELLIGLGLLAAVTAVMSTMVIPGHTASLGEPTGAVALNLLAEPIEDAGWSTSHTVGRRRITVELPPTIAGDGYRIEVNQGVLWLRQPDDALALRRPLQLPDGCQVEGEATGGVIDIHVDRTVTSCTISIGVEDDL